jgi:hypothetical protein
MGLWAMGRGQGRNEITSDFLYGRHEGAALFHELGVQTPAFPLEAISVSRQLAHMRADTRRRFGFAHVLQEGLEIVEAAQARLVLLENGDEGG